MLVILLQYDQHILINVYNVLHIRLNINLQKYWKPFYAALHVRLNLLLSLGSDSIYLKLEINELTIRVDPRCTELNLNYQLKDDRWCTQLQIRLLVIPHFPTEEIN